MNRLIYLAILLCVFPVVPWWATVSLAVIGILAFPHYAEALIFLFVYDLAFGLPSGWLGTQFALTAGVSVFYLLAEGYKSNLRFYQS